MSAWVQRNGWTLNFGTQPKSALEFSDLAVIELRQLIWQQMRCPFTIWIGLIPLQLWLAMRTGGCSFPISFIHRDSFVA